MDVPPIWNAQYMLTRQCQLRCTYCYEDHRDTVTTLDVSKSVINFLMEGANHAGKAPRLSLFGGEPLLYYEELMKPIITEMQDRTGGKCGLSFVTNGLLLDEEKLRYFKANNVGFMLSIDGCREAQDANRVHVDGHGSFDELEQRIPAILSNFPMTTFRMTLTPASVPFLFKSVQYAASAGFIQMHIVPDVFSQWSESDYRVLAEQMGLIRDDIIGAFENGDVPLVFEILGQMFPRMVINQYEDAHGRYRKTPSTIPCNRCGLGVLGKAEIDESGNLFGCFHGSMEPNISNPLYIGNIYSGVIKEQVEHLLELNEATPLYGEDCATCALDRICTGGCIPNNFVINGDFNHPPQVYCKWSQIVYQTAEEIVAYFDAKKDNDLFKYFFWGQVNRGVCAVC